MFPTLPNRLLIAAAVVLGAWVLASAAGGLRASDGTQAITLLMSHRGAVAALGILIVAAIPAVAMSVFCSSVGNPLSGLFALTTALWMFSAQGGTMDDWIRRTDANLPGDYRTMAMELILWSAVLGGFMVVVLLLRPRIRRALPMLAREPHLGEELTLTRRWWPAAVSGIITAVIGGILANLLLRTPDKGQIVGGLIAAFTVGGLIGDLVASFLFQKHPANPLGIIFAPAIAGIVGYLATSFGYADGGEFLKAYYDTRAAGLALALPIDFASAGVAGAAMGAGWSQVMLHGDPQRQAAAPPKTV